MVPSPNSYILYDKTAGCVAHDIHVIIIRPHRMHRVHKDAVYCYRCSVIALCVCLLDTTVSPTRTDEPIELWTRLGSRNHKVGWGTDPPGKGAILGVIPHQKCMVPSFKLNVFEL